MLLTLQLNTSITSIGSVHSQYYKTQLAGEFVSLVENLEEMSTRWRGLWGREDDETDKTFEKLDLAGKYALRLSEYHSKCLDDADYAAKILPNSAADAIVCSKKDAALAKPHRTYDTNTRAAPSVSERRVLNMDVTRQPSISRPHTDMEISPMHHAQSSSVANTDTHSPRFRNRTSASTHDVSVPLGQGNVNGYYDGSASGSVNNSNTPSDGQDNLLAMSDALMGQSFANLDRVIMSDGTDFSFNAFEISDFAFGPFDLSTND